MKQLNLLIIILSVILTSGCATKGYYSAGSSLSQFDADTRTAVRRGTEEMQTQARQAIEDARYEGYQNPGAAQLGAGVAWMMMAKPTVNINTKRHLGFMGWSLVDPASVPECYNYKLMGSLSNGYYPETFIVGDVKN